MTQTNRILIVAVAAVAAVALFFFMVISPKRDEVAALGAQVQGEQDKLAAAQVLVADYAKAKSGYKTAYASVVRLGKAVPADDDIRSLVVQLDATADRSGVDFRTINVGSGSGGAPAPANAAANQAVTATLPPGATVGAAGFPTMPFDFSFRGSFGKLSKFFSRLDRFVTTQNDRVDVTGRLLMVDAINLQPDSTLGYPFIRAQVKATSYLVSPDQGLTAGATAQGPGTTTPASAGGATGGATTTPATTATSTGAIR